MIEAVNIQTGLTLLTLLTIVFSAGTVYAKLIMLEKKIDKMDNHGERIAKLEANDRHFNHK